MQFNPSPLFEHKSVSFYENDLKAIDKFVQDENMFLRVVEEAGSEHLTAVKKVGKEASFHDRFGELYRVVHYMKTRYASADILKNFPFTSLASLLPRMIEWMKDLDCHDMIDTLNDLESYLYKRRFGTEKKRNITHFREALCLFKPKYKEDIGRLEEADIEMAVKENFRKEGRNSPLLEIVLKQLSEKYHNLSLNEKKSIHERALWHYLKHSVQMRGLAEFQQEVDKVFEASMDVMNSKEKSEQEKISQENIWRFSVAQAKDRRLPVSPEKVQEVARLLSRSVKREFAEEEEFTKYDLIVKQVKAAIYDLNEEREIEAKHQALIHMEYAAITQTSKYCSKSS